MCIVVMCGSVYSTVLFSITSGLPHVQTKTGDDVRPKDRVQQLEAERLRIQQDLFNMRILYSTTLDDYKIVCCTYDYCVCAWCPLLTLQPHYVVCMCSTLFCECVLCVQFWNASGLLHVQCKQALRPFLHRVYVCMCLMIQYG